MYCNNKSTRWSPDISPHVFITCIFCMQKQHDSDTKQKKRESIYMYIMHTLRLNECYINCSWLRKRFSWNQTRSSIVRVPPICFFRKLGLMTDIAFFKSQLIVERPHLAKHIILHSTFNQEITILTCLYQAFKKSTKIFTIIWHNKNWQWALR